MGWLARLIKGWCDMDRFQRYQQDQAELLRQAAEENAQRAQDEATRLSAEREAERQAKIAENLGNA